MSTFHKGVTPKIQTKKHEKTIYCNKADIKQATKLLHTGTHKHDTTTEAHALDEGLHPMLEKTLGN